MSIHMTFYSSRFSKNLKRTSSTSFNYISNRWFWSRLKTAGKKASEKAHQSIEEKQVENLQLKNSILDRGKKQIDERKRILDTQYRRTDDGSFFNPYEPEMPDNWKSTKQTSTNPSSEDLDKTSVEEALGPDENENNNNGKTPSASSVARDILGLPDNRPKLKSVEDIRRIMGTEPLADSSSANERAKGKVNIVKETKKAMDAEDYSKAINEYKDGLVSGASHSVLNKDRPLTFLEKLSIQQDMERKEIEFRNRRLREQGVVTIRTSERTEAVARKLLDDDERLKERHKLLTQASKGYFSNYNEVARLGVKFWPTSRRIRSKLISPLMLEVTGINLSEGKLTRLHDICRNQPCVVFVQFNEFGRIQNQSYLDLLRKKFPNGIVQKHQIIPASKIDQSHGLPVGTSILSKTLNTKNNQIKNDLSKLLDGIPVLKSDKKEKQAINVQPSDIIEIPERSFKIVRLEVDSTYMWQVLRNITDNMNNILGNLKAENKRLDKELKESSDKKEVKTTVKRDSSPGENESSLYLGIGSTKHMMKRIKALNSVKVSKDIELKNEKKESILDEDTLFKLEPTTKEQFEIERLRCGLINDTLGWVLVVDKGSRVRWCGHASLGTEVCSARFSKVDKKIKDIQFGTGLWDSDSDIFERIVRNVVLEE